MANSYTTRLKKRLPAVGDVNWDDEWHDNEKIDEVVAGALLSVNRVISGGVVTAGTGLVVNYTAAVVWMAGARLSIVSGSLTMTAAPVGQQLVNWVYVNGAGTVVVSATPPSGDYIPLAQVDTSDTAIVRIADLRPMSALDKDASGGVAGLTGLAINFMNALGTIKSILANANTAARTYTFQDRDGTIADNTDLAGKADTTHSHAIYETMPADLMHVRDERAAGTAGGSSIVGFNTRVLQTVRVNEISGASLNASNQIILPAGTYDINAAAVVGGAVGTHKLRIYNVTAGTYINSIDGLNASSTVNASAILIGSVTLTETTTLELRHYTQNAVATVGFGLNMSVGNEIYASVLILRRKYVA